MRTIKLVAAIASLTLFAGHPGQHIHKKHHQKHQHHQKCQTRACKIRVGRAWAKSHPVLHWHTAGASIFGEPCESGSIGYRGRNLNGHPDSAGILPAGWSFAELDMGTALGGLPNEAEILIRSPQTQRETIVVKNDIGAGGGPVGRYPRAIDLYAPVAKWLADASCNWTGVVEWAHT